MAIQSTTAFDQVYEFLTSHPTHEAIITFRPSQETQSA